MGIQRIKLWQRPEGPDDWKKWAEKHLRDHSSESSLRIQDFDHARLGNVHQAVGTTDSPSFVALTLTQTTGTAPMTISSTTAVTNLNADLLDGNHAAAFESSGAVTTHESTYNHTNYNTAYGWGNHASAGYEPGITAGTSAQYWRGDKSWQTLNQAAVSGLTTASSPVFAGLTLTGLSGVVSATAGVLSAATLPVQSTTDITTSLTWDGGWHDFDFTASTSATARWVILSVYADRAADSLEPIMFGPQGTSADGNCTIKLSGNPIGGSAYACGGVVWLPLDADQLAAYHVPANYTNRFAKVIGYM